MIGNIRAARMAVKGQLEWINPDHGARRNVYRDGDVVYKVDKPGEEGANEDAIRNYERATGLSIPKLVKLPLKTFYRAYGRIVVAMEYIDGIPTGECYCPRKCHCKYRVMPDKVLLSLRELGLDDLSYQNVRYRDGFYIPIDFDYVSDLVNLN